MMNMRWLSLAVCACIGCVEPAGTGEVPGPNTEESDADTDDRTANGQALCAGVGLFATCL